jgi:membrane protease YdiL (CAAX protease family)
MTPAELFPAVPEWLFWAGGLAVAGFLAIATRIVHLLRCGLPVIPQAPVRPVPWNGGDVGFVVLAYLAAATLAAASLGNKPTLEAMLGANVVINTAITLIAVGWLSLRGAGLADLGLAPIRPRRDLRLAIAGWAFVLAPLLALAAALNAVVAYDHPVVSLLGEERSPRAIAIVIMAAVIAAPIAEELFFRRILLGWIDSRMPSGNGLVAIVVSATAFALAHQGQGLAYVPLLPLGIVLGFIARRTGSIVPCILLHGFFNAVSVGLLLADSGPAAGGPAG